MAKTKDERYIIKLYEISKQNGSFEVFVDRYEVGAAVGFNPNAVNNICRNLAQANFLKVRENGVKLTEQGLTLIAQII